MEWRISGDRGRIEVHTQFIFGTRFESFVSDKFFHSSGHRLNVIDY